MQIWLTKIWLYAKNMLRTLSSMEIAEGGICYIWWSRTGKHMLLLVFVMNLMSNGKTVLVMNLGFILFETQKRMGRGLRMAVP